MSFSEWYGASAALPNFTMTLDAGTTHSRTGDSDSTINSFFSSLSDPGYFSSTLNSSSTGYTGYYGVVLDRAVTVTIRCKGASSGLPYDDSWGRCRGYGRDVQGVFSLASGTEIHFFAGKVGQDLGSSGQSNSGGAGGGASVVYTKSGSTLTPLVIGAGGSAYSVYADGHNNSRSNSTRAFASARSLEGTGTTAHADYRAERNAAYYYSYGSTDTFGIGRAATGSPNYGDAGGGGAGWTQSGRDAGYTGTGATRHGTALNGGAQGGVGGGSYGPDGGFGGGGGAYEGNGYSGAGAGYIGGIEVGSASTVTNYSAYSGLSSYGDQNDDDAAPISYVASSATSWSDNGLNGSPASSGDDPADGGEVIMTFVDAS
jgi:hypothetical protein